MRLALISDTHFGTERPPVVEGLLAALARLRPDALLLCGDITQRARPAQFAAAARFLARLPAGIRRMAIPGNHDLPLFNLWARWRAPYAAYESVFGARETLWRAEGMALLALDATHPRRHKDGYLDPRHLRMRLAEARAACGAGGLLIVAAHQPLWTAWAEDAAETLIDRHETARLLAEARADVMLSGHVHVPLVTTSATSHPPLPWRFVLCGAGTAVSHRTRPGAPNSFSLLDVAAQPLHLDIVRYDWAENAFAVKEAHRFRRGGVGWDAA